MTREKKLEAIYKEMANKELTPWCCVEVKAQNEYGDFTYRLCRWDERPTTEIKEIIGHPVMIGDVIEYSSRILVSWDPILMKRDEFRKPIEDQTNECIDYVYSLIKKS